MGQIKFITSLVMAGLFAIAIVSFAINFAYDNDSPINIADDPDLIGMKNGIITDSDAFYSDVNISRDAMDKSTISTQTEASEGGTAFKVGPTNALSMVTRIMQGSYVKVFGSDQGFGIFLTSLISLLLFISIMLIYKAWAGRNPE